MEEGCVNRAWILRFPKSSGNEDRLSGFLAALHVGGAGTISQNAEDFSMGKDPAATPIAVVVDEQEWTARTLESILGPSGYGVLKVFTGNQALNLLERVSPDVFLVDHRLPDMEGAGLCERLRAHRNVRPSVPILVTSSGFLPRAERVRALQSGAWDVVSAPFDADELRFKLGSFLSAKVEADRARQQGLLDSSTGFYNVQGVMRRVQELVADASRNGRPLACVAVGPSQLGDESVGHGAEQGTPEVPQVLIDALRKTLRTSDAIGRFEGSEFIILAPSTDEAGGIRLAERVLELEQELREALGESASTILPTRAGIFAVNDPKFDAVAASDLLGRATRALRRAQFDPEGERIRQFEMN
jgi:diguanylate cyclase (GGDEF)-like protein